MGLIQQLQEHLYPQYSMFDIQDYEQHFINFLLVYIPIGKKIFIYRSDSITNLLMSSLLYKFNGDDETFETIYKKYAKHYNIMRFNFPFISKESLVQIVRRSKNYKNWEILINTLQDESHFINYMNLFHVQASQSNLLRYYQLTYAHESYIDHQEQKYIWNYQKHQLDEDVLYKVFLNGGKCKNLFLFYFIQLDEKMKNQMIDFILRQIKLKSNLNKSDDLIISKSLQIQLLLEVLLTLNLRKQCQSIFNNQENNEFLFSDQILLLLNIYSVESDFNMDHPKYSQQYDKYQYLKIMINQQDIRENNILQNLFKQLGNIEKFNDIQLKTKEIFSQLLKNSFQVEPSTLIKINLFYFLFQTKQFNIKDLLMIFQQQEKFILQYLNNLFKPSELLEISFLSFKRIMRDKFLQKQLQSLYLSDNDLTLIITVLQPYLMKKFTEQELQLKISHFQKINHQNEHQTIINLIIDENYTKNVLIISEPTKLNKYSIISQEIDNQEHQQKEISIQCRDDFQQYCHQYQIQEQDIQYIDNLRCIHDEKEYQIVQIDLEYDILIFLGKIKHSKIKYLHKMEYFYINNRLNILFDECQDHQFEYNGIVDLIYGLYILEQPCFKFSIAQQDLREYEGKLLISNYWYRSTNEFNSRNFLKQYIQVNKQNGYNHFIYKKIESEKNYTLKQLVSMLEQHPK